MLVYPFVYLYRNYFSPVLLLLTSYNPYAPKSVRQCVGYYNGFIGTLVSEAGASNRDDILSMPEMRASGTGVLIVHWYKHLCPIMLLIAFKLITYGTARVKTSEHVNLCISLYTKNCLYHNLIPILTKYFPNCFQISMSTRCLIQWLCEDISVGGGCLRQGYFAYSCLIRVLRVTSPIWQGAILHNHIYVTTL